MAFVTALIVLGLSAPPPQDSNTRTGPPPSSMSRLPPALSNGFAGGGSGPADGPDGDDILVNEDLTDAQNENAIAINPKNEDNWVAVANDYRNGVAEVGWYATRDAGATWRTGTFGLDPGFVFSGDPAVAFTPDGKVHVVCMMYQGAGGNKVVVFTSSNGGWSWGFGQEVDLNPVSDKPQIDADHSTGAHRGDLTVAFNRFNRNVDVYVCTSTDGGATWNTPLAINDTSSVNTWSPDVAYGADSTLWVMWADQKKDELWADRSTDGGNTFGGDFKVGSFTETPSPLPGSSFRTAEMFSIAADWTDGPHSGNVYIAYHDWNDVDMEADVVCATSTDDGASWTHTPVHTDVELADQIFPGIDTDPQGNVHVVYYDRRADPNNFLLWTWLSRSSDGGQTWSEHAVSDIGWDHTLTEFNGTFIGDYLDVESSAHRVLPFWTDGRSGSQDVYTDPLRLDLFTDVDSLSAATGGVATFSIAVGPNFGGAEYWVLGSYSGTDPGLDFGNGVIVPINWDLLTRLTVELANSAIFSNFRGTLDSDGRANAVLDTLGPFDPNTAGLDLHFAALIRQGGDEVFASNPTLLSLTQ